MSNFDPHNLAFYGEILDLLLNQGAGGFADGGNGANGNNGGNGGTGGNGGYQGNGNGRGPYVRRACKNCKRRHIACSNERPCQRCLRDNVPCVDAEQKPRGRPKGSKNKPKDGKVTKPQCNS